jgi:hypothetical protein
MSYNPRYYAQDAEWVEWIAAEYEAAQAQRDITAVALEDWRIARDDFAFAAAQRYRAVAVDLASKIEDDTDVRLMEAEQADAEYV